MKRKRKLRKGTLVYKNHRYYENGKLLRKSDYIFHASSDEPEYILTNNGKYRIREVQYV